MSPETIYPTPLSLPDISCEVNAPIFVTEEPTNTDLKINPPCSTIQLSKFGKDLDDLDIASFIARYSANELTEAERNFWKSKPYSMANRKSTASVISVSFPLF